MKNWIDWLFSDLQKKINSWFILFKSSSIGFKKYEWNINQHCRIEKHVASWYIN